MTVGGNARVSYPQLPYAPPNNVLGVVNGSRGEQQQTGPGASPDGAVGFWRLSDIYIYMAFPPLGHTRVSDLFEVKAKRFHFREFLTNDSRRFREVVKSLARENKDRGVMQNAMTSASRALEGVLVCILRRFAVADQIGVYKFPGRRPFGASPPP
jgi:hypothetical protein